MRRLIETVREGLAAAVETTASDGADEAIVVAPSMTEKVVARPDPASRGACRKRPPAPGALPGPPALFLLYGRRK